MKLDVIFFVITNTLDGNDLGRIFVLVFVLN